MQRMRGREAADVRLNAVEQGFVFSDARQRRLMIAEGGDIDREFLGLDLGKLTTPVRPGSVGDSDFSGAGVGYHCIRAF